MQHTTFKEDVQSKDLFMIEPALFYIYVHVVLYCKMHSLPCRITSIINDRKNVIETSDTHKTGRAFDISIDGFSSVHVEKLVYSVNAQFRQIGAISKETGEPVAAYAKPHGTGPHIHFQVRPNAPFWNFVAFLE